ncbi:MULTISPECIES: SGNH/GDSL hydrolase family protein [Cyanophyceae]|uniref:SGNH/GDSL hydrolase family protein n=1 Tax=Cyanophyceae TaxID=3028117 RepID=UPI0016864F08|nr:SGNH/GDSL hydrolase family protein [Trichocoleus sp. FACHB-69]MBD1935237.1 SGNH/GDSL hydrolase family protein [Trichocoleus sp. FACHB-69]
MLIKKILVATAGAAIAFFSVLGFPNEVSAKNFDEIYVFGDSISDVGNAYKVTRGESPSNPPYFRGRYSNGLVWADYLAAKLKLKSSTETNFAFGGAKTGNSRQLPPGLLTQIETFKATHASADPKALYIIWAGANDYLGGATDSTAPVNNLSVAVKSLADAGAKNIVVVNLPDLGKLPGTRISERSNSLNNLTQKHNSALAASLNNLRQQLSDIKITYLDVNSLFNQVVNNPEKFGFTNVTNACLSQVRICNNPNEYLFWDNIHPTTAAHKLLVELAFESSKPAPQPVSISTPIPFVMGAIAFGAGTGFIIKRQKAVKN